MGKLGPGELMVILIIALVIFGPSKLPALGKMAGKAVGSFKHYLDSSESWDLEEELSKPVQNKAKAAVQTETAAPVKTDNQATEVAEKETQSAEG